MLHGSDAGSHASKHTESKIFVTHREIEQVEEKVGGPEGRGLRPRNRLHRLAAAGALPASRQVGRVWQVMASASISDVLRLAEHQHLSGTAAPLSAHHRQTTKPPNRLPDQEDGKAGRQHRHGQRHAHHQQQGACRGGEY